MHKKDKLQKKQTNGSPAGPKFVEVTFALQGARAKEVYLSGDFNNWSPTAARMIQQAGNGIWEKRLSLLPGRYEYKFVVDGKWTDDPKAHQKIPNNFGSINSVVEVRL